MAGIGDAQSSYRFRRWYASGDVASLLSRSEEALLGELTAASQFNVDLTQRQAWIEQLALLKDALSGISGRLYFEYDIPRLGKRVDVVLLTRHVVFVLEFKVGETQFTSSGTDQAWDYALDLRNFHETSHDAAIAPVLIATEAEPVPIIAVMHTAADEKLANPIHAASAAQLREAIEIALRELPGANIDPDVWERGRYQPTPTIIEAARALYAKHSVAEIARNDASAENLYRTSGAVDRIILDAQAHGRKSICFVTGVPGAGKTLVGLDIATRHRDRESQHYSVFLSGNGPLVAVLREALIRDAVSRRAPITSQRAARAEARQKVEAFIQNVHHFRDEGLRESRPPFEHVALFDEAQRAWDLEKTSRFMRQRKGRPNFNQSEPEFLIACMDRHGDWSVVVCLVGSGQEIHSGEAGISEWLRVLLAKFPKWHVHLSRRMVHIDPPAARWVDQLDTRGRVEWTDDLHLSVSMRSFRAERLSEFVRLVLSLDSDAARALAVELLPRYPIYVTRDLDAAKRWVRSRARGSERYGLLASSKAIRLKPHAIHVKAPVDPIDWFLEGKDDIRSSYYLEDPATEFLVQGLELDWACVVWDGDLRYDGASWSHNEFKGTKWNRINKMERQRYLENAYRVLLTRARQGLVIVVPEGVADDRSRSPQHYDMTFELLRRSGLSELAL